MVVPAIQLAVIHDEVFVLDLEGRRFEDVLILKFLLLFKFKWVV